jgi:hypothetical protein
MGATTRSLQRDVECLLQGTQKIPALLTPGFGFLVSWRPEFYLQEQIPVVLGHQVYDDLFQQP